jgi:hypothetical protein
MQRGNLVIYDQTGKIFSQTGEAEGSILQHEYPVGIPWIEIPFGTMATKKLISIDVSITPHQPIFEDIPHEQTDAERIAELENQLLLMADNLEGGIL